MKKKIAFVVVVVGSLLLWLIWANSSSAVELKKVTCCEAGRYLIKLPLYLADSKGFFKDEGLDVSVKIVGGRGARQAILSGQAQFAVIAYGSIMNVFEKGKHIQSVAGLTRMCFFSLVSKPEIKSINELRGKKIGVGQTGDETYVVARSLVRRAGLDPEKDVRFVGVGYGATMLAAYVKGAVDAIIAIGDWKDRVLEQKPANVLVNLVNSEDSKKFLGADFYPLAHVQCSADYVKKDPQTVQKFVNAIVRALHWIKNHNAKECVDALKDDYFPDASHESLDKFMAEIKDAFSPDGMTAKEGHEFVRKVFMEAGVIKGEASFEKICNLKFVRRANEINKSK